MSVKQGLYHQCEAILNQRLKTIQHTIADIQHSLLSETKSSAGNKHETGRAMLQLEREKAGQQSAELKTQKKLLYGKGNLKFNAKSYNVELYYSPFFNFRYDRIYIKTSQ